LRAAGLLIVEDDLWGRSATADSSCGEFAQFKSATGRTHCGELVAHLLDLRCLLVQTRHESFHTLLLLRRRRLEVLSRGELLN
jgi:hypothetical protein